MILKYQKGDTSGATTLLMLRSWHLREGQAVGVPRTPEGGSRAAVGQQGSGDRKWLCRRDGKPLRAVGLGHGVYLRQLRAAA